MKVVCLSLLTGLAAGPAAACDLCGVYSADADRENSGRGVFAGWAGQYTSFGTLQTDGRVAPNDGEYLRSFTSQFFAGYNFNDRVGLQLNVPVIARSFGSNAGRGTESGLGDVSLIGNLRLYQKTGDRFTFTWTALGGLKLPTGDSRRLGGPDFAAGIGGHDLALGSGSYDGVVGTGVSAQGVRFFVNASAQYAIRTEGDFGHRYANDLTWSGGPGVILLSTDRAKLGLQFLVSGEGKGRDTVHGVPDQDSAASAIYVGPQWSFAWNNRLSAQFGADLPVNYSNTGTQVVVDYRLRAAIHWRF